MTHAWPRARVLAAALGGVGLVAVAGFRYFPEASTSAALLLLLTVLLTGAFARLPESIVVAFAAALCLDYFYIPPVGSITVEDRQGWVALAVFLATSITAGKLASRFQKQQGQLIEQRRHTESLHALSHSMLLSGSGEEVRRSIVNSCMQLFALEECALFDTASNRTYGSHAQTGIGEERLRMAAKSQRRERDKEGALVLMPVALGNTAIGSIALRSPGLPDDVLDGIANTVAVGLAHAQAQTAAGQAEAVRKSEELKSVMIDALAHELKSPLTAIEASAEMLAETPSISEAQRADLLAIIREESHGLRRLMEEAIHLARIDAEKLKLASRPEPMSEIVASALASLGDRASGRTITVTMPDVLSPIPMDRELMTQAVKQLIDNALKYAAPPSKVEIGVREIDGEQTLSVRDSGPGLTELEQAHVFDKFYRGRYDRSAVQGTGMGLAIAKEIAEAHGGAIGVRSRVGQGSEFFIRLRCAVAAEASPVSAEA